MSAAKAAFSVSSVIALPPYLTTTMDAGEPAQPGQRIGQHLGPLLRAFQFGRPAGLDVGQVRGAHASPCHVEYAEFSCT